MPPKKKLIELKEDEPQLIEIPVKVRKPRKKAEDKVVLEKDDGSTEEVPIVSYSKAQKMIPVVKEKKARTEKQQEVFQRLLEANKKRKEERDKAREEEQKKAVKKVIVKPKVFVVEKQVEEKPVPIPKRKQVTQTETELDDTEETETTDTEYRKPTKKYIRKVKEMDNKVQKVIDNLKNTRLPQSDAVLRPFTTTQQVLFNRLGLRA